MKTTDDSGAGPWPLPVEFDPDDTGSRVLIRSFWQWKRLWGLTSAQTRGRLVSLRNDGEATNDGKIWKLKDDRQ